MPDISPNGVPAAAAPAPGAASPAAGQPNGQPATSPATSGSAAVNAGGDNRVPYDRFSEVNEEKKHFKSQFEEAQAKAKALEEELDKLRNPPPVQAEDDDVFTNAEGFVSRRVKNSIDPLQRKVQGLEKLHIETLIKEEFSKDAVMQKVFGTKEKLFEAIADLAVKNGVKEMTPEIMGLAFEKLIVSKRDEYSKAAIEMGKEEERTKAKILDGTLPPEGGGGSPGLKKGVPTAADKKVLSKFGWDDKKIAEYAAKTSYDSDGRRVKDI